jgi:DNA polymerase III subunit delta'
MFIGNAKALKLLEKSIENGTVSHAYLFSGPEHVGKYALATFFSESLITGNSLRLVINKNDKTILPDLMVLEPEIEEKKGVKKEKNIPVEAVRKIQHDLSLFPFSGKYKVLIINDAHKMSVAAQNALLKTLEEPNETSILILVTHDASKIIPTIQSRCRKVIFGLADEEEMQKIVPPGKDFSDIALFSMGRPGIAVTLSENRKDLGDRKNDFEVLLKFKNMGINERFKIAEKLSSNPTEAVRKMEFWKWIIRKKYLETPGTSGFFTFKTLEKIEQSLEVIKNTNANVRLVLENLFLEI